MAVPYILIRQKSPPVSKRKGEEIVYARSVSRRKIKTPELAERISKRNTLSEADLMAALYSESEVIIEELSNGNIVHLERLGSFRVVATTPALEKGKKPRSSDFRKRRIVFSPDPRLKETLKNISFMPR